MVGALEKGLGYVLTQRRKWCCLGGACVHANVVVTARHEDWERYTHNKVTSVLTAPLFLRGARLYTAHHVG